jgi:FAD:protein FMN transferase
LKNKKMNLRSLISVTVVFIIFSVIFTSCASEKMDPVERQDFHMGTVISQKSFGSKAQKALEEVDARMIEIENRMTINAPGSETDKLNNQAGKSEVKLSPDVIHVLSVAKKYAELSDGAFDVTVGPLVQAWGIFTDHARIPEQNEIDELKKLVGNNGLTVDEKNNTAKLAREGQIADLGGIAKGYAGDEAIRIYKENGLKAAYVNLGGNVVVMGKKPDGTEWNVGVQNPRGVNGQIVGILKVSDKAVVSSGDYERFFEQDGKRYHHIIDPKTGYPSESDLMGTTIVTESSTVADALSTSTFVLGLEKGMKLVENLKGVEALFITKDKKIYITPGLKDKFTLDDDSKEYTYVEKR